MNVSSEITQTEPQACTTKSVSPPAAPPEPRWSVRLSRPNWGQYLEVPFMHKRLLVWCMLLSLLTGWLALMLWPRGYESEAKLMVKVGRESVSLDPTATTSQTLMLQKTQEEEINSALEVLSSRAVAEKVVEQLGAGNVLDGILPQEGGPGEEPSWLVSTAKSAAKSASEVAFVVLNTAGLKDDISDHELAVRRLQSTVVISASKKSTVITVHAESKTPEMAQAIAQRVVSEFLEQHLQVSQTEGSQDFFSDLSQKAREELQAMMTDRSRFMQERKIVSIDANRALLKDQLTALDRDTILAEGSLEQALAESEDVKQRLADTKDEIVATKFGGSDVTWSGMRQKVYELEIQEQKYAALYTGDHELLVQTREQLEGAREILAKMQSERIDESTTPNPEKRRLQEELQKQETKIVGLRSTLREKQRQRDEIDRQVNDLLDFEQRLAEMDREIGLKESSLGILREKQEEARVIDELQTQRISNISIFQPATFVERASSPNKKLLAAAFVFLGICSGLGLAFLKQISATSIRSPSEVEVQLDVPVVAVVPESRRLSHSKQAAFEDNRVHNAVRNLVSEVLLGHPGISQSGFTLGVVSAGQGAGATTLATQLALVSSDDCDLKTILVDADAKRRSLSRSFGLNGSPGLIELVSGDASHDECLQHGRNSKVGLIACSSVHSDERMQSRPAELAAALNAYRNNCDLLVVDLPPADQPDQATGLAPHLDGLLLVVESEVTEAVDAERVVSRMLASDSNLIGVVLNKHKNYLPRAMRSVVRTEA
ncbi:MAG: GumC family protein [Aureliella sp.]